MLWSDNWKRFMGKQLQLGTSTATDFNSKKNIIKTQKKGKLLEKKIKN
jgi:hypothetical protein